MNSDWSIVEPAVLLVDQRRGRFDPLLAKSTKSTTPHDVEAARDKLERRDVARESRHRRSA